ncbi:hypothetical protein ACFOUP_05795 [Belliella kenyensis]|uniref:DUF4843 domain-containing protein n=1 Tax=Belliella kenyensis TaxID=1472724 RepID=A0ABV8EL70_9BACT|nr:hypothetical protein [Belliella kenyensis]MCH7401428.1 hypothetical protein [Belliella kenyensis]MDN3602871.1 hypothetical protein [Belliella kenyensis]
MKKLLYVFAILFSTACLTACFEDNEDKFLYRTLTVEFQDAVITNPAAGFDYPLVATLRNNAGIRTFQVNLFGGLSSQDQIIPVRFISNESTAVEGTHFSFTNTAEVIIPAGEAIAFFSITVPELTNSSAVRAVFELQPNASVKVNENYRKIAIDFRR